MQGPPTIAVLAGGLATRLGDLSKHTPKSLLSVSGRPFLAWQLDLFAERGLNDVVLCVGHYGDQVQRWVAEHCPPGMRVRFSFDGPRQLGTGGALQQALPLLGERFLVTYGDSYLECDYLEVFRKFCHVRDALAGTEPPLGLMTVFENRDQFDTSNVLFRDGTIVRYDKRNRVAEMRHIDWGLSVLTREAFEVFTPGRALDLATVFERLVEQNRLLGFEVNHRFYEVGSVSGLNELSELMATKSLSLGS